MHTLGFAPNHQSCILPRKPLRTRLARGNLNSTTLPALTLMVCTLILSATVAAAQDSVADFYKNKTISLFIGYGPGGGYDLFARIISRHMPRHIPGNPAMVPVNMPGASSMLMANHLAKRAPQDGTAFGAVNSSLVFDTLFAGSKSSAQFRGPDMTMIGNAVSTASVLVTWHASGVKTLEDVRSKGLIVAAASRSGSVYLLPLAVKNILGFDKMRFVLGYPGTREVAIAMERGEVTGRIWDMDSIQAARPQWLKDGSINIVAQLAPKKMPEVPANVPLISDSVPDAEDRRVLDLIFSGTLLARPYIAPPNIPADRRRALRDGFMATMKDPNFLAEIKKLGLTISPTRGEEMEHIVHDAYAQPESFIAKVRRTLSD